jgi:hypothetical protein
MHRLSLPHAAGPVTAPRLLMVCLPVTWPVPYWGRPLYVPVEHSAYEIGDALALGSRLEVHSGGGPEGDVKSEGYAISAA